jgi:hypothetical protein
MEAVKHTDSFTSAIRAELKPGVAQVVPVIQGNTKDVEYIYLAGANLS